MSEVLVPIDFSDCTPQLLDRAGEFGRRLGATVVLLHVSEAPIDAAAAPISPEAGGEPVSAAAYLDQDARSRLEGMQRDLRGMGATTRVEVRHGPIGDSILAAAESIQPEFIIMGTHGRTGLSRVLLGSIAEHVMRRSNVPVMTVRTVHRPECAARSCAVCATDQTEAQQRVAAELDG